MGFFRIIRSKTVIILLIFAGSLTILSQLSQYRDVELRDNQIYLRKVFLNIAERYVEDVNLPELLNVAIEAMVDHLDPYSEFLQKDAQNTLQLITEGTYGGLGMEIGLRDNNVTVISPIDDTPAQRAGIRPGDIILTVEGKSVKGLPLDEVSAMLRGPVGTPVKLEIQRPGLKDVLVFELKRDKIVLKDVSYATFVEPGIAYVKLTGFTEKAPSELKNSIYQLQKQDSIRFFILDLRNNPGGLLSSAVEIANIFLPEGSLIVKTAGKNESSREYRALNAPLIKDQPLVVLVDGSSASASEIVAGAIQDLDRGVIVGDTSFGKGLVQKIFPIDDIGEKQLKLTTAKYYTPSGRCIQREDYKLKFRDIYQIDNVDSLLSHKGFLTRNGRKVFSQGGIAPDVFIEPISMHPFLYQLSGQGHFFRFIVEFISTHRETQDNPNSVNPELLFTEFSSYLEKRGVFYQSVEQKEFAELLTKLEQREDITAEELMNLRKELDVIQKKDKNIVSHLKNDLTWALQLELATQLNEKELRFALMAKKDVQLHKAIEVLKDKKRYQLVLRNSQ